MDGEGGWLGSFVIEISDDLNTPRALALMWDLLKSDVSDREKSAALGRMDEIFGLGLANVIGKPLEAPADVLVLAEERQRARQNKDWKKSDELRDRIREKGWIIDDAKDGSFSFTQG